MKCALLYRAHTRVCARVSMGVQRADRWGQGVNKMGDAGHDEMQRILDCKPRTVSGILRQREMCYSPYLLHQ